MKLRDTLLLAAADPADRAALREILQDSYNLLEAENCQQAKLLLRQNENCLAAVLLSLTLPAEGALPLLGEMSREGFTREIPVLLVAASNDARATMQAFRLGACDTLVPPFVPHLVHQRVQNVVELYHHKRHLEDLVEEQAQAMQRSNQTVVDALSSMIEFRSAESGRHVLRLRRLTQILLRDLASCCPEYGLTERTIQSISSAAALHDIGKIAIPDSILNKKGALTPEEYEIMKTHTVRGSQMLKNLSGAADREYLRYAYDICRYHHERWDGKGYPEGLKGDQIPLSAQVVGLADAFDALTNDRAYKAAYPYERAVNMILGGECGTFSPQLLECFKHVREELAEVIRHPEENKYQPAELPPPESVPPIDTLQLLQNKYQAVLHYVNATVVEVDFDYHLHHTIYNPDPDFVAMHPGGGGFQLPQAKIHPEDRAFLQEMDEYLRTQFLREGMYRSSFSYRAYNPRISEYQRCHVTLLRLDTGDPSRHSALVIWRREQEPPAKKAGEYAPFADTPEPLLGLLSAVVCCRFDCHLSILKSGDSLFYLLGYQEAEIREQFQNRLMEMILPEDREDLEQQMKEQLRSGTLGELEFRMRRADGKVIWIMAKTRLVSEVDGTDILYLSMVDNTRSKHGQEILRQALARNQIFAEQSSDILFEWDLGSGHLTFSQKWEDRFGYPAEKFCARDDIPMAAYLHPDDLHALEERLPEILAEGKTFMEVEVRIVTAQGRYLWNRLRISLLRGKDGELGCVLGALMDIDQEKRNTTALQKKAEEDSLTGLLNKNFTNRRIEEALENQKPGTISALLILDMDNFKQVNDTYGHPFGDTVLTRVATQLRHFFRSGDVIGRIGGDEFMILLKNVPDVALVEKRCQQLLRVMNTLLLDQNLELRLSCSLGVSLAPEHGTAFQELFQKADRALYQAKVVKDRYVIYSEQEFELLLPTLTAAARTQIESDQPLHGVSETELVRFIFRRLYETGSVEDTVLSVLEAMGRKTDVSRVYIFENDPGTEGANISVSNTFEWCREGIPSEKAELQHIEIEKVVPGWFDNYDEYGVFYCTDLTRLPPEQQEILSMQGIRSTLQCTIRDRGVIRGFIGFDDCETDRLWTQEQIGLLQVMAEALSLFLLKERAKDEAQRRAEDLLSVLDQQDAWVYVVDPETCEIRYRNQRIRQQVPAAREGSCCYEALLHRDSRCEDCPANAMGEGKRSGSRRIWDKVCSSLVETEASLIHWNGKPACLVTSRRLESAAEPERAERKESETAVETR